MNCINNHTACACQSEEIIVLQKTSEELISCMHSLRGNEQWWPWFVWVACVRSPNDCDSIEVHVYLISIHSQ